MSIGPPGKVWRARLLLRDAPGPVQVAVALGALSVVLGLSIRVSIALTDHGIYWPDEIYQSLEPAHRLVFGYGLVPWEFIEGARSWAFPALVGVILAGASLIGLDAPEQYLLAVRLTFIGVAAATGLAALWLARAHGARAAPAAMALVLLLLSPVAIYFSHRALSETASGLCVVAGLALCLKARPGRARVVLGASLLGIAVLLRLQCAVFCAGLPLVLAARRQWRAALDATLTLVVWAFVYGLVDRLTWGTWYQSALVYLRFNLLEGKAAQWGTSPFAYYATTLFSAMPAWTLVVASLSLLALRRAAGLWLLTAAFVLLHSWTPHKELRFFLPVLPLLCALAAIGLSELELRAPRVGTIALASVFLLSVLSAARARTLTFGQLGQYVDSRPNVSAYDDAGPINRLLLAAHRAPELCGLKMEAAHLAWTGGYSYLHRNVPLYPHTGPPRSSGYFNHVITLAPAPPEATIARDGRLSLVRLFQGPCLADPAFSWRLP